MELMIISNPWTKDPKSLVRELERRMGSDMDLGEEEPDHLAFQRLKSRLAGRSKNITVK